MKTYNCYRGFHAAARCDVHHSEDTGAGMVYPLPHLVHHSPTGYEWGYGGSGPSDLARSIVGDLLGTDHPDAASYQAVKRALVAALPLAGGQITEEEVRGVLAGVTVS